jgi:hypothetical protein
MNDGANVSTVVLYVRTTTTTTKTTCCDFGGKQHHNNAQLDGGRIAHRVQRLLVGRRHGGVQVSLRARACVRACVSTGPHHECHGRGRFVIATPFLHESTSGTRPQSQPCHVDKMMPRTNRQGPNHPSIGCPRQQRNRKKAKTKPKTTTRLRFLRRLAEAGAGGDAQWGRERKCGQRQAARQHQHARGAANDGAEPAEQVREDVGAGAGQRVDVARQACQQLGRLALSLLL